MSKNELYSFSLLSNLTKKIYEQDAKIDLILKYIADKKDLPETFFNEIGKEVTEANIESVRIVQLLMDNINNKTNINDLTQRILQFLLITFVPSLFFFFYNNILN